MPTTPTSAPDDPTCAYELESGRSCRRKRAKGSEYCKQHAKRALEAAVEATRERTETAALTRIREQMGDADVCEALEKLSLKALDRDGEGAAMRAALTRSAELRAVASAQKSFVKALDSMMSAKETLLANLEAFEENKRIREAQEALLKSKSEELERLRSEVDDARARNKKLQELERKRKIDPVEGRFMTRDQYRKVLEEGGIDIAGMHVFHIIAASHGGPDHTHNYLFCLGETFNMSMSDKFDTLCCFMADKAKAEKAVNISIKVSKDPTLHKYIDARGGGRLTYEQSVHAGKTGSQLFKQGQDLWRQVRSEMRSREKEKQTSA